MTCFRCHTVHVLANVNIADSNQTILYEHSCMGQHYCMARQCWPIGQYWRVLYNQSNFYRFFRKHLVIGLLGFLCDFYWSPSIGKPRMTPVFFVKTTQSYEVKLVTINRQTSYDSGIRRQDYGLIRGLPVNRARLVDLRTRTQTGRPNNQTRRC